MSVGGGLVAEREGRRGMAVVVTRAAGGDGGDGDGKDDKQKASPPPPLPPLNNNNNNSSFKPKRMNPKRIASPQFSSEAQTWALLGGLATAGTIILTLLVAANDDMAYFGGPEDFSYMVGL